MSRARPRARSGHARRARRGDAVEPATRRRKRAAASLAEVRPSRGDVAAAPQPARPAGAELTGRLVARRARRRTHRASPARTTRHRTSVYAEIRDEYQNGVRRCPRSSRRRSATSRASRSASSRRTHDDDALRPATGRSPWWRTQWKAPRPRRDAGSLQQTMGFFSSSGDGNGAVVLGECSPVPRLARRVSSRTNTTAHSLIAGSVANPTHERRGNKFAFQAPVCRAR